VKTLKPLNLGLLTRVFENDHRPHLVVSVLIFFPFEAPRRLLPEVSLWKFAAAELGKDAALDLCMPKLSGEVLVNGYAFPIDGPKPACSIRVRIGSVDKELYVVGDRRWELNGSSDPAPFERMAVTWENAFGGEDYPPNPRGKGSLPLKTERGKVHPLPNIEDPKRIIGSPSDKPLPAGFGAYEETWPQRFKKIGTYDKAWLDKRFPGFAEDMDYTYFNVAPEDQWIEGYFKGDEAFTIDQMHPSIRRIEGRLPGVIARCFVTMRREGESGEDELTELPMRLDTVRLFPHAQRGVLIYRAVTRVEEDDAADVRDLLIACDPMDAPRPKSHYAKVRANRLDPEKGALFALKDQDLLPPKPEDAPRLSEDDWNDTAPLMEMEHLTLKNARKQIAKKVAEGRKELTDRGLEPDDPPAELPPERAIPTLEELPEFMEKLDAEIAEAQAEAKAKQEEAAELARAQCAEQGIDYDALIKSAEARGGPPAFSADKELERLRDLAELSRNAGGAFPDIEQKLADPALEAQLREAEARVFWAYRNFTHHMPAAAHLGPDASARVRDDVMAARAGEQSLARRDLTGADLSGLDLGGMDLTEALLEGTNFKGSILAGADLTGSTLARADLTGADLTGAKLVGTNLAQARVEGANLTRADLTSANLTKTDLARATLAGAPMKDALLDGAMLAGADLSGAALASARFMGTDLTGCKLRGADLSECIFNEISLDRADLSFAILTAATFVKVSGKEAVFREARADNIRCVMECAFPDADFTGANLEGSNLRATNLAGATLSGARLVGADLSECNLIGAKLYRAVATGARFSKADLSSAVVTSATLMNAILERAKIYGADFRGANLFRADMARVQGDKATNFKDANLKQVRVVAARPARTTDGSR
jgi:uncharacterized protein YjbI with pentapeptide repeats